MAFVRYFDEGTRTVGEQFVDEGSGVADATTDAVDILDAARSAILNEVRGRSLGPVYAYDGPYALTAALRPCEVTQKAPYAKGKAPNGAYVRWMDRPAGSYLSEGGWTREQYRPVEILTHAIVRIAGSDGPVPA